MRNSTLRFCLLAMVFCVAAGVDRPASAQQGDDLVGRFLGCDARPDVSPYCTDPELRGKAQDYADLWMEALAADRSLMGEMTGTAGMLRNTVQACGRDVACIGQALEEASDSLRAQAGLGSAPEPGGADIAAIIAAARERSLTERSAELEAERAEEAAAERARQEAEAAAASALTAQMRANETRYRDTYAGIVEQLAPYPEALERFTGIYESPEDHFARRDQACSGDLACQARWIGDTDRMGDVGEKQYQQAVARAEAERLAAQKRAEQAALAEARRIEAETRMRLQREQRAAALATARRTIETRFPPDSLARLAGLGDYARLDAAWSEIVARDIAGPMGSAGSFFVGEGMGRSIREGILANRANLLVAHYAMTRMRRMGGCGDEIVSIYRRSVAGTQTRTLGGIVLNRSPGFDVYSDVPVQFARHVRASNVEGSSPYFRDDVALIGQCDSLVREIIEANLLSFARGDWRGQ